MVLTFGIYVGALFNHRDWTFSLEILAFSFCIILEMLIHVLSTVLLKDLSSFLFSYYMIALGSSQYHFAQNFSCSAPFHVHFFCCLMNSKLTNISCHLSHFFCILISS